MPRYDINKDINALIKYVRERGTSYHQRNELLDYLKRGIQPFCSEELLYDIVVKIVSKGADFEEYLCIAKELYDTVCYNEENIEEIQVFNRLLTLSFDNLSFIEKIGIKDLYSLFEDKKIFLDIIRNVESRGYTDRNLSYVLLYITKARQLWVDENAGYSSIMDTLTRIQPRGYYSDEELAGFLAKELETDNYEAGNVEYKSSDIRELARQARVIEDGLHETASESEILKAKLESLKAEIQEEYQTSLEKLESKLTKAQDRIKRTVETSIKDFRETFNTDREQMITDLKELKGQVATIKSSFDADVTQYQERLRREVEKHIRDIEATGTNQYNLIVRLLELHPEVKEEARILLGGNNRIFDNTVSLRARLDEFYARKLPDELYHQTFDKIAKDVIADKVIWIVGPTGSGKSYIFKQIARLAGVPYYNLGFVTDETMDIKGFMDAQGNFHSTQFYDAYKYGGICFFDEIDNSESRALIELNKIMGSGGFEIYTFPNKEKVAPHPNFRLVAAGNTWGDGADPKYPDRITVDKAIRNRFTQWKYDYDPNLERSILHRYPEAYDFLSSFRASVDKRSLSIVVTTRDMTEFRNSLDQECYTPEEIITGRLIQNNRKDVLTTVLGDIKSTLPDDNAFLIAYQSCLGEIPNVKQKSRS